MRYALLAVLLATPLAAGTDIAEMAAERAAAANARLSPRLHPNMPRAGVDAINSAGTTDWMFIGGAGSLIGGSGFFRSDVTIANGRNVPQNVRARFIPRDGDGFSTRTVTLTIPANSAIFYEDFVGRTMGQTGLGALEFVTRTSSDGLDLSGEIDVFSRIYTEAPTGSGTVSQTFIAADLLSTGGTSRAFALGLQHDENFRTNVGIVNLDLFNARTWTVQVIGSRGSTTFTMTVAAFSMKQQALPTGIYGPLRIVFTPEAAVNDFWQAYASTNDNRSGDGWVSPASQVQ